jgi:hypothetical protein
MHPLHERKQLRLRCSGSLFPQLSQRLKGFLHLEGLMRFDILLMPESGFEPLTVTARTIEFKSKNCGCVFMVKTEVKVINHVRNNRG